MKDINEKKSFMLVINSIYHEVTCARINTSSPFTILPSYAPIIGIGTLISYVLVKKIDFTKFYNKNTNEKNEIKLNLYGVFSFQNNKLTFII